MKKEEFNGGKFTFKRCSRRRLTGRRNDQELKKLRNVHLSFLAPAGAKLLLVRSYFGPHGTRNRQIHTQLVLRFFEISPQVGWPIKTLDNFCLTKFEFSQNISFFLHVPKNIAEKNT